MSPRTGEEARRPAMTGLGEQRLARAALAYLAEPADPALGALLGICEPAEILAAIKADLLPATGPGCGDSTGSRTALERALGRWRARLPALPGDGEIEATCREGIKLVCPGDPRWPRRLDELGSARPYALWLRGRADLAAACVRSVSMVGSRAATGYGAHVAGEMAADLAEQGWVIVSGGPQATKTQLRTSRQGCQGQPAWHTAAVTVGEGFLGATLGEIAPCRLGA